VFKYHGASKDAAFTAGINNQVGCSLVTATWAVPLRRITLATRSQA
jgi:hypothetical protein